LFGLVLVFLVLFWPCFWSCSEEEEEEEEDEEEEEEEEEEELILYLLGLFIWVLLVYGIFLCSFSQIVIDVVLVL
jgi:CO dehydrogenase/acetyl-CoA synthase beta subunit